MLSNVKYDTPLDIYDTPLDSEILFRQYASFVASFLYRLGTMQRDVNDLVQDVFMTAHKRGGYRPGVASPKTFLARICLEVKLARERHDARWRNAQLEEAAAATVGDSPQTPEGSLALQRAAAQLQHALEAIEPGARAVFVLFELHGESCESIAAALDIKLGTVYSRLHNARKEFFAAVDALGSEPPRQCASLLQRSAKEAI